MLKNKLANKKGFTIIEVVLVLAIAGLIFLMVFIALPALQKSQRDTQRRNDLGAFTTALQQYMTNNRGAVPNDETKWKNFLNNYLNNSMGTASVYLDPDGEPYRIVWAKDVAGTTAQADSDSVVAAEDKDSTGTIDSTNPTRFNFFGLVNNAYAATSTDCVEGASTDNCVSANNSAKAGNAALKWSDGATDGDEHKIYTYGYAQCDGEDAVSVTNGKRRVAFRYKLEGAGTYCGTN